MATPDKSITKMRWGLKGLVRCTYTGGFATSMRAKRICLGTWHAQITPDVRRASFGNGLFTLGVLKLGLNRLFLARHGIRCF